MLILLDTNFNDTKKTLFSGNWQTKLTVKPVLFQMLITWKVTFRFPG